MRFDINAVGLRQQLTSAKAILSVCLVVLLVLAISAFGPEVGSSEHELQSRVQVLELDNGVQVVIVPSHGSGLTTVNVWVRAGSSQDPRDREGLAHYYEHMVFKGSERYPGQADTWIESKGGYVNASTNYDYTEYHIEIPSEHTELAVNFLADMVTRREFSNFDMENERNVVLRERDTWEDDPAIRFKVDVRHDVLGPGPYARPVLGTVESIKSITVADLVRWSAKFYVPENMIVVVVGDVEQNHLEALVDASFGSIEKAPAPPPAVPGTATPLPQQLHHLDNHGQLDRLAFAWALPPTNDLAELAARQVLSYLLFIEIHIDEVVDTVEYEATYSPGHMLVEVEFPKHVGAVDVRNEVLATLANIQGGHVEREYVALAKKWLTEDLLSTRRLGVQFADQLGLFAAVTGDPENAFAYIDQVAKVNKRNLVALASQLLVLDQRVEYWMVAGDDAASTDVQYDSYESPDLPRLDYMVVLADDLRFVITEIGMRASAEFMQLATWAKSMYWVATNGKTKVVDKDGVFILDNGVRFLLLPDPSTDFVEVYAVVGSGVGVETADNAGLSSFTGGLLMFPLDVGRFLFLDAYTEVWSEYDETTLVLKTTSSGWPAAVSPFLRQITRPELNYWDLDGFRSWTVDDIRTRDEDPFEMAFLQLRASLYGVGGYANPLLGTLISVNTFELGDIDRFHEQFYTGDNVVFVAAGNFNQRLMLATLAQHLGSLPPSAIGQDSDIGDIMFEAPRTVSSNRDGIQLSWIMVGLPGPRLDSVDYTAFRILNSIMGSGASSRLFTYFREQEGDVYVAHSDLFGLKRGSFMKLFVQVLPEDADKFVDYTLSEVRAIAKHGISDEELQVAIAREVGHQLRLHEWIGTRGMLRGIDILLGAQHTGDQGLIHQLESVSVDDVRGVADWVVEHHVVSEVVPSVRR